MDQQEDNMDILSERVYWIQAREADIWHNLETHDDGQRAIARLGQLIAGRSYDELRLIQAFLSQDLSETIYMCVLTVRDGVVIEQDDDDEFAYAVGSAHQGKTTPPPLPYRLDKPASLSVPVDKRRHAEKTARPFLSINWAAIYGPKRRWWLGGMLAGSILTGFGISAITPAISTQIYQGMGTEMRTILPISRVINLSMGDDIIGLRSVLDQGASPHTRDSQGRPVLLLAGLYGTPQSVKTLLEYGANPLMRMSDGLTIIHHLAAKNRVASLQMLLDYGYYSDSMGGYDDCISPLSSAIANGHLEPVKLLLDRGASLKPLANCTIEPRDLARSWPHIENYIDMVYGHIKSDRVADHTEENTKPQMNSDGGNQSALAHLARLKHEEISADDILRSDKSGLKYPQKNEKANRDISIIPTPPILPKSIVPSVDTLVPPKPAELIELDELNELDELDELEQDDLPSVPSKTADQIAALSQDPLTEILESDEEGPRISNQPRPPLRTRAIELAHLKQINTFEHADPIKSMIGQNDANAFASFLDGNPNLDVNTLFVSFDEVGQPVKKPAIDYSLEKNSLDIALLLFERGAVAAPDLLHDYSEHPSDMPRLTLMLRHGVNPNTDKRGLTPLMVAAKSGNYAATEALIGAGAFAGIRTQRGRSAYDFALEGKNQLVQEAVLIAEQKPYYRDLMMGLTWRQTQEELADIIEECKPLASGLNACKLNLESWARDSSVVIGFFDPNRNNRLARIHIDSILYRDGTRALSQFERLLRDIETRVPGDHLGFTNRVTFQTRDVFAELEESDKGYYGYWPDEDKQRPVFVRANLHGFNGTQGYYRIIIGNPFEG